MSSTYNKVSEKATEIKRDYSDLTDFEALQIACSIQSIETLKDAFMLTENDNASYPSSLEGIAMALGLKRTSYGAVDVEIDNISRNIDRIADASERQADS